jgi:hypothetical protein
MTRKQNIFFGLFMALAMSAFMGFFMTLLKAGLGNQFLPAFLESWGIGFVVSLTPSFTVPPLIHRLIKWLRIS